MGDIFTVTCGQYDHFGGMNSCALALDRFKGEIDAHVGHIEAGLSLGASSGEVDKTLCKKSFSSQLNSPISTLCGRWALCGSPELCRGSCWRGAIRLRGFVPVCGGVNAVCCQQFVCSGQYVLVRRYIFTKKEQLILRPEAID